MLMKSFKKLFLLLLAAVLVFSFAPAYAQADEDDDEYETSCIYDGFYGSSYADITVTDSKGNEYFANDYIKDGTELTVKVTLKEGYEWGEYKQMYVQGQVYDLDKKDSFKFTVNREWSQWFTIDFNYYPKRNYTIKIKADKNVKSYEFINKDGSVKTLPAGEKSYELKGANALSSGTYSIRVIFEKGYELDTAEFAEVSVTDSWGDTYKTTPGYITRTSDIDLIQAYLYSGDNYTYTINITSKKATSSLLDSKKYTVVAPTVKTSKFKKPYSDDDYYTATTTLTFGKGKKATTFSVTSYKYSKKGEVYSYLNYDGSRVPVGSDASKYEVLDFSGVTGLSQETMNNLVGRIYSAYKQDKFPNLKAIYLPKGIAVPILDSWDGTYYYYPIKVITVK